MERKMTQLCELTQIGRIVNLKEVGQNLMISAASDASYRRDGEWVNRANWIEHTVFGRRDKMKDWALDTLQAGDLVFIRSTPSQTNWARQRRRASARAPGQRRSLPRPGPRRAPFPRPATRSSDAARRHERRLARRSPPRGRDRPSPVPRPP